MRVDKKKNLNSVATELLKNPLQTVREVSEKTGVSKSSVANYINQNLDKIGQKDENILNITNKDLENIVKMQEVLSQKIGNPEEMKGTRLGELAAAMREATARYSLFRGNATDEQGGARIGSVQIL